MGPRVDAVSGDVLFAERGSEVFQEFAAVARREGFCRPLRLLGLNGGQPFFRRHNRTAEAARFAIGVAKRDHQVVELHDGPPLFIHHPAVVIGTPIPGGTGQHDVSRFGIDEHELNPLQAGQILHHAIGLFPLSVQELHFPLQARETDFAKNGSPPRIARGSHHCRRFANFGQGAINIAIVFFEDAGSVDINARGELRDRARTANVVPGIGINRGRDQFNERIKVRHHAAAARTHPPRQTTGCCGIAIGWTGRAKLTERPAASQVAANVLQGEKRGIPRSRLGLCRGNGGQGLIAVRGRQSIRRRASRTEFTSRQMSGNG